MKAILLAGGLGTRMREETEFRPKPMVEVGGRPVLWHIMKLLSHQGLREFVILTGYRSDVIRRYFFDYEHLNLDFTIQLGKPSTTTFHGQHDEAGWSITVVDTGPQTLTGERILRAREFIGDSRFLLTYGDGLADINLARLVEEHEASNASLTMSVAKPNSRFGVVERDESGLVKRFLEKPEGKELVNMGFMIAEPIVFQSLGPGQALEDEPLRKLAEAGKLGSYFHEGFWQPMDTQRELELLNEMWESGDAPWATWKGK
jgi:glucose-1-phosphate cytidylyltransferase